MQRRAHRASPSPKGLNRFLGNSGGMYSRHQTFQNGEVVVHFRWCSDRNLLCAGCQMVSGLFDRGEGNSRFDDVRAPQAAQGMSRGDMQA
jgi:hypothetical protein